MAQSLLIQCAKLHGIGNKFCFISLPKKWITLMKSSSLPTFQVESPSSSANIVLNWAGEMHSTGDNVIYINNIMLKNNGFTEGEVVYIFQIPTPSPCLSVFAELNSIDAWNNLDINYDLIQSSFLDQVRVVKVKQKIPLWLEGGCIILINIQSFGDSNCSEHTLIDSTIINIAPPKKLAVNNNKSLDDNEQVDNQITNSRIDTFNLLAISFRKGFPQIFGSSLPQKLYIYELLSFRTVPDDTNDELIELLRHHPTLVIISKMVVINSKYEKSNWFVTNIECIKMDEINIDKNKTDKFENPSVLKSVCLALVWENFISEIVLSQNVRKRINKMLSSTSCIVSDLLKKTLLLSPSDILEMNSENVKISFETEVIDFCPISNVEIYNEDFQSILRSYIKTMCKICPLILNNSVVIYLPKVNKMVEILLFIKNKCDIFIDHMNCCRVSFNFVSKTENVICPDTVKELVLKDKTILYDSFFKSLVTQIEKSLNVCEIKSEFVLLEGDERSGKTKITRDLINYFQDNSIYCRLQKLKLLNGKNVDISKKNIIKDCRICLLNQPSILFLDDLDHIAPSNFLNNQEDGPLYEYILKLSVMLKNIIKSLTQVSCSNKTERQLKFVIFATCKSRYDINSILSAPNGYNLFPIVLKVPSLNFEDKLTFMYNSINTNFLGISEKYGKQQEIYNITIANNQLKWMVQALSLPELKSFSRRVTTEAIIRCSKVNDNNTKLSVCECDFIKACKNLIPLSIKEINKKNNNSGNHFIGGLNLPQSIIKKSILWPLRHPQIFSQVGLNARTGILLYGPPGCGKTLLANSIASSCNLNFIFVKGAELLSKYIGESEKSVRDIFMRGRSASPCIIFFDEFDALAPRRGHDNTGVTDRVVNQLLTQMDGVEGNNGVFILAATSRPDLIDPALLRPGRLDKPVYCPLPDKSEREKIFEALSRHLELSEPVDWEELSGLTGQLTGADIQGIFSTAQVIASQEIVGKSLYSHQKAVKYNIDNKKSSKLSQHNENVSCSIPVKIGRRHLIEAINTTKRSISVMEIKKYHEIYQKFGAEEQFKSAEPSLTGSKYTLA